MNYISVENISKSYGDRILFNNISFGINKSQKIAFVAKNGTGKTSILNIIAGVDIPDEGQVIQRKDIQVAYLSRHRLGTYLVALEGEYQDGDELGVQPLIYEYL